MSVGLALLTRDLRVRDNRALAGAVSCAARTVPVFVFDDALLATSDRAHTAT